MVTVQDMLTSSGIMDYPVLAGHIGLTTRQVSAVSFIDAPTSLEWLRGNELIITSGYLFGENQENLYEFIVTLINKNVSALGIKLGRYVFSLSRSIIDIADKHQFVIFSMPYNQGWSESLKRFYGILNRDEQSNIFLSSSVNHIIKHADYFGGSLSQMWKKFLSYFKVPSALIDNKYSILAKNFDMLEDGEGKLDALLKNIRILDRAFAKMPYRVEKSDMWISGTYLSPSIRILIFTKDYFIPAQDLSQVIAVYDFVFHRRWSSENQEHLLQTLLESLELMPSSAEIHQIGSHLKFRSNNYFNIALVSGPDALEICQFIENESPGLVHFPMKNYICAYTPIKRKERTHYVLLLSLNLTQQTHEEFNCQSVRYFSPYNLERKEYQICFGESVEDMSLLTNSFLKAKQGYAYAQALGIKTPTVFYRDFQIIDILKEQITSDDLQYIHSSFPSFDAIQTLEAYLHDLNVKNAADRLFVHENSIRYRLLKIQEAFGFDYSDPIIRANLLLKIKIWRIKQWELSERDYDI